MTDSSTTSTRFDTPTALALEVAFDGGRLTSDGGLPWLAKVDGELGLCGVLARCVPEWRSGPARHSLLELIRQRVYQIASGYEDQDDSDHLRSDPLLKLVCSSLPESGADLASQPTMSRLENAVTATACLRMAQALGEVYIRERGKDDEPKSLYDWYVDRGTSESWIKDYKLGLKADRLSCHRFLANQLRLILHAAAYWLLDTLGRKLVKAGRERMQLETLRLRLIKIDGRVKELLTKVKLHLVSSHPGQPLLQAPTLARE